MANGKYYTLFIISSSHLPENIQEELEKENFTAFYFTDETAALSKLQETKPDLILLNPGIPTPEKCSIIRRFRKNPFTQEVPVIFISSIDDETLVSECLNFGYTDFIAKPLRTKELLLRIHHQLSLVEAKRTIRRQNERLKQTIESRDKLYAVIAHDLRSPIGTIKMINSAIENEKEKIQDPGILKKFEMINETTEEAFNLLENLLRWTRNQNGKTKVIAEIFDLSIATRQVLSLFTTIANAKNIRLSNQLKVPLYVYADEDMVKTVLRNLISNAIKFTFPGGEVELDASRQTNTVTLAVKDNGQGISPENQCLLLKKGHTVSTYGTKHEKGCGLGLLLSQDFIKRNKGKLWFVSEEGKGTTFYFTLPLSPQEKKNSQ